MVCTRISQNCTMKRLITLLWMLELIIANNGIDYTNPRLIGDCYYAQNPKHRPHSVSVLEFGAVGDGKTLNTVAFDNAIFYLKSFADKGGAQLYIPSGQWLISSITLTSHLTLFLEKDAVILGSQDFGHWDVVEGLPSYGPRRRYSSLITGNNLTDVIITGNNGTIDGQGSVWWEKFNTDSINYNLPHILEFTVSNDIVISNLTFLNAPAWSIHPIYCSNFLVQNVNVYSHPESPYTSGIVPDSSEHVCIENTNISTGYDAISVKSGWDEYGLAFGKPTTKTHIRGVRLRSSNGSGLAFGSEMSGGIREVLVEHVHLHDSFIGFDIKTAKGRGGYIQNIRISDVLMENIEIGIRGTGHYDSHPDGKFDPYEYPVVNGISIMDVIGNNVTISGKFDGIYGHPFDSICLSNITFSGSSFDPSISWECSNVYGSSYNVSPEPCPDLSNLPAISSGSVFRSHFSS